MKRQADHTTTLVYAYGCAAPTTGLEHIQAEAERQRAFWNVLVGIDRHAERQTWDTAATDAPEVATALAEVDRLSGEIDAALQERRDRRRAARAKVDTPDLDAQLDELFPARKEARAALLAGLKAWRKALPDRARAIETERREHVKAARQASGLYWGNYNRVLQSFDTARKLAAKKGRRLRESEEGRENGCLTVQIQRCGDGLGASAADLMAGRFKPVRIAPVDPRAFDAETPRGEHRRLCRTAITFRVDAAGHTVTLPLTLHRLPPDGGRIKSAQITWLREGERLRWQLALTVSSPAEPIKHPAGAACGIDLGWRLEEDGRLLVATLADSNGELDRLHLPADWMAGMDQCERLSEHVSELALALVQGRQATLHELPDDLRRPLERWRKGLGAGHVDQAALHDAIRARKLTAKAAGAPTDLPADLAHWYERYRHLALWRDNLRAKLKRRRREVYRLWAKSVAERYAVIGIEDMDLSQIARTRQRQDASDNPLPLAARANRVRAALYVARGELEHQAAKTGARIEPAKGPSTAECTACGHHNRPADRARRVWLCEGCGTPWDQDINAATNLLRVATGEASGAVVRASRKRKNSDLTHSVEV